MDPQYQNGAPPQPTQQPAVEPQPFTPSPQPPVTFMAPPTAPRSKGPIIAIVILSVLTVAFAGVAVWAFMAYNDQKSDVDARIEQATAKAVKDQREKDKLQYDEALKRPYWKFNGPADYGGLGFNYPKTWDVYVEKDGSQGDGYAAYLDKGTVPPVQDKELFALRVTITNDSYDKVLGDYGDRIKKGDLKSSPVKVNGQDGARIEGNFSKDQRGTAVIYKIRDKTLIMQTDINSGEIKDDFEALIKTITFNT